MSATFIGSGRLLVACGDQWLASGEKIHAIVSACPEVTAWANARGLAQISPARDLAEWLAREPFDYLFSIVNHAITPEAVLALPRRRAINYHDSPLPRYAGFNATAWAIIDGQAQHAVTWHEMTGDVDGGRILLHQPIEIRDDDTSFTLGAKCSEAGLESFGRLIALLRNEAKNETALPAREPGPRQDFHLRSDRPGVGLINFCQPAARIHAFIRGLDLGSDDNWMCRPRLRAPAGIFVVGEASLVPATGAAPGTVLSLERNGITVAALDGAVRLSALTTLEGDALDVFALRLQVGQVLDGLAPEVEQAANILDASLTKHERFWVQRLAQAHGPALADLKVHSSVVEPGMMLRAVPEALFGEDKLGRRSALVAAMATYLARVGEAASFDLALQKALPAGVAAIYVSSTPMRLNVKFDRGFDAVCATARQELETQDRRGSYARDAVTRYSALRAVRQHAAALTIGVRFQTSAGLTAAEALVAGTHLTLVIADDGETFAWAYDRKAISDASIDALADRVDALLADGVARPGLPVAELNILPAAERERLLTTWQDTSAPYDNHCIHHLFEQQVARSPGATAVVFQGASLTYRELDERANRAAEALRSRGVGPEVLVGVCVERSIDMIIGLMGVLKAGGAYVPLDPAYPRERLDMMLEDSKAKVLLTQRRLSDRLSPGDAQVMYVEDLNGPGLAQSPSSSVEPDNLAYVIFTSGSTGRPKGVMVKHGNVANFFVGMDATIGSAPGVWLAVTSISFDISVLELFWTLTRGFEVVIQGESDRASLSREASPKVSSEPMDFGLFYFAADQAGPGAGNPYRLLLEGAKFADTHDFSAVWTPERHFHAFGGLYPNPAVTTAALATITSRVALRAGSVVLPLHNPLRVAEDWSVVDQLSGGRVGLSFASGWHTDDFAFMPQNFERRREIMLESIDTVMKLWRGEKVDVMNGQGKPISVSVLPRPIQSQPPMWIASAGSVDTFKLAGRIGANVLTNMLGQDLADLKAKFAAYRKARAEAGHVGAGNVSVMLHTFVCESTEKARTLARKPFCDYLTSSFDLIKVAPSMFPAFRQPSLDANDTEGFDPSRFTAEDMTALMDHAFDRYFETAGLFGSPEKALAMVERLKAIGANEVACLIDFGIDPEVVLESLPHLDRLRRMANAANDTPVEEATYSVAAQIRDREVTHLQCTPSMARMLTSDADGLASLGRLKRLMLGGEALPNDLVDLLAPVVGGEIRNMYGPTETTIWSTTSPVHAGEPITIGRPIANTVIRILDARNQLAPVGVAGELCIGGAGVVRGYLGRPDLTAERFIADPYDANGRLYRTGDLARYRDCGDIEFLGRLDLQVKVNGYRIELGDIETVLGRHSSVRQNVVVARADDGSAKLVAYVIGNSQAPTTSSNEDRVAQWQGLWDEAYKQAAQVADARFNIAGWNDSYTGAPIPAEEMREWLDGVTNGVLELKPRRVLEIGCGTGMVLYRIAPHVDHYTAVDLSAHALKTIREELTQAEASRVVLLQQPAHALSGVPDRSFDTVIINSVAQYFPDAEYFAKVLARASALVVDGGHIYVGDVRSREHLDAFQTVVTLHQAPGHLDADEVKRRIDKRVEHEGELVLSEDFFHALKREAPRIVEADVRLKRGRAHNEMSAFRYDVVLHVGDKLPADVAVLPPPREVASLDDIRRALADSPAALVLNDLKNARLSSVLAVRAALLEKTVPLANGLLEMLDAPGEGFEPDDLRGLHADYHVDLVWARSGDPGRFDAVFRHKVDGPRGRLELHRPVNLPAAAYANQPAKADADQAVLFDELRAHLREFLPEYMIPSTFVLMDAFPLTPNGKIDRKALPAPIHQAAKTAGQYMPPSNQLEETIAGVWKGLLNVERVGLQDNIFDLGANSLLTAQANQRLSALLERKVSLVSMFRFPTVQSLAAYLDDARQSPEQVAKVSTERDDRKRDAASRRRALREAVGAG